MENVPELWFTIGGDGVEVLFEENINRLDSKC